MSFICGQGDLRLSPSLLAKGSAKLEKAEILQMTVDHLKMLHAAGGKGMSASHLPISPPITSQRVVNSDRLNWSGSFVTGTIWF